MLLLLLIVERTLLQAGKIFALFSSCRGGCVILCTCGLIIEIKGTDVCLLFVCMLTEVCTFGLVSCV